MAIKPGADDDKPGIDLNVTATPPNQLPSTAAPLAIDTQGGGVVFEPEPPPKGTKQGPAPEPPGRGVVFEPEAPPVKGSK